MYNIDTPPKPIKKTVMNTGLNLIAIKRINNTPIKVVKNFCGSLKSEFMNSLAFLRSS